MPKSDQSMYYDLDYLFAYLELPKVKNPLFRQKRTCNLECEISGMSPDFHNKILKPFLNVDTFESGILHVAKKPIIFFCKTFYLFPASSTFSFKKSLFLFWAPKEIK